MQDKTVKLFDLTCHIKRTPSRYTVRIFDANQPPVWQVVASTFQDGTSLAKALMLQRFSELLDKQFESESASQV